MKYIRLMIILCFLVCGNNQLWSQLPEDDVSIRQTEHEIRLTLGLVYRNFDDVKFNKFALSNHGNEATPGGPFGVQGYTTTISSNSVVFADYIHYLGGEDDSDKWAPSIGFEMPIGEDNMLDFVFNFSFFSIQSGEKDTGNRTNNGNFSAQNFSHLVIGPITQPPSNRVVVPMNPATQTLNPNFNPGTNATVENDFDLEMYMFDFGLKGSIHMDALSLCLAAGPTLTISDAHSVQKALVTYSSAPADDPSYTGVSSQRKSDSDTDFILGLYGAIDLQFQFNDSLALAVGYRYDFASDEAGTKQAEQDLETHGARIRLIVSF